MRASKVAQRVRVRGGKDSRSGLIKRASGGGCGLQRQWGLQIT
jgi:hypothetical protein